MGKTIHVYYSGNGWAVKSDGKPRIVHSTRKEAVESARCIARKAATGQLVVHGADGRITQHATYGLPKIQQPPRKSRLGTKAIAKAVGRVALDRLKSDPLLPRG